MGFLRRLVGGGEQRAPDWASFMSRDEHDAFIAAVEVVLVARGYSVSFTGDGGVQADGGPNPGMYGLFNLGQVCHASPRTEWPAAINRHFAQLEASARTFDGPLDLETAKPLLRLRAFRVSDSPPEMFERVIFVPLAENLVAALAIDLPTTVRTTSQEDLDTWGVPLEELLEIAKANMADEVRTYERTTLPTKSDGTIELLIGDSFFVSSQAIRIDEIAGPSQWGTLVAMPNRHQLLWHMVSTKRNTMTAMEGLITLAMAGYRDGPGSLTPDIYWWRDGTWVRIPVVPAKGKVEVTPPDAFVELLEALP